MRNLILIPFVMLLLNACMTQRDKTVWQDFKDEIFGTKAEVKSEEQAAPAESPMDASAPDMNQAEVGPAASPSELD